MSKETKSAPTEAKKLLTILLHCDPLVGDTACHLRAIHLLFLYHHIQKQIQAVASEQEEIDLLVKKDFLEASLLLTKAQTSKLDPTGLLIGQKTNTEIPELSKLSRTKKDALIAEARQKVATETLGFVKSYYQSIKDFFTDNLSRYLLQEDFLYLSSKKVHTPILPFYLSCKIMLDILAREKLLLIVHIKRLAAAADVFERKLLGEAVIYYCYDDTLQKFVVQDKSTIADNAPGLKINMYSCLPALSHGVEKCFDQVDSSIFFQDFKQLDIAKIILMCAVGHIQVPDAAQGSLQELNQDFNMLQEGDGESLMRVDNNIHQCSKLEFTKFLLTAKKYTVFGLEASSINPVPPIQVNHVHLSTAGEAAARLGIFSPPAVLDVVADDPLSSQIEREKRYV
ncbi:MAG: hypothetical protein K0S08_591 [Gammaproteobacteria bacterium]|jgi:hypothetical protein|nr:hypothetical protein [Gammaproteobacteria bacterium]